MVYKNIIIQQEIIEKHRFCDICGKEIPINIICNKISCSYCKKDLCENCIGYEEETGGDYRYAFCKECWEIGKTYRLKIEILRDNIDILYKKWQDKCKVNIKV